MISQEIHYEGLPDQNTCSFCGLERLLFEPPPRFCALCFKIINSTGCYYAEVENGKDKSSICSKCHHLSSSRAKYVKKFNYAETDAEAEWVMFFFSSLEFSILHLLSTHLLFTCHFSGSSATSAKLGSMKYVLFLTENVKGRRLNILV